MFYRNRGKMANMEKIAVFWHLHPKDDNSKDPNIFKIVMMFMGVEVMLAHCAFLRLDSASKKIL